jgi:hypothetical protein
VSAPARATDRRVGPAGPRTESIARPVGTTGSGVEVGERPGVSPGPRELRRRRDAFRRYATLLAAQLEALGASDLPRFAELADERAAIAEALGSPATGTTERRSARTGARAATANQPDRTAPFPAGPGVDPDERVASATGPDRPEAADEDPADSEALSRLHDEIRELLAHCQQIDRQLIERLRTLRGEALREIRELEASRGRPAAAGYPGTDGPASATTAMVDVQV